MKKELEGIGNKFLSEMKEIKEDINLRMNEIREKVDENAMKVIENKESVQRIEINQQKNIIRMNKQEAELIQLKKKIEKLEEKDNVKPSTSRENTEIEDQNIFEEMNASSMVAWLQLHICYPKHTSRPKLYLSPHLEDHLPTKRNL